MNQLVNVSKVDYFLASTVDDSILEDSMADSRSNKSFISKTKSKGRATSGISHLKKKRRVGPKKNADLIDDNGSYMSGVDSKKNVKKKKRIGSTSPFPQQNLRNKKNLRKDEKSTDIDEDSKQWGLAGKGIDKKNSTKVTHDTTSENGDNSWIISKGHASSNEKKKRGAKFSRGNSKIRPNKNPKRVPKKKDSKEMEEEKIHEEIDAQDSYSHKFDASKNSPHRKGQGKKPQDCVKELNKTDTLMKQNRKKIVPNSDPNSGVKNTAMHFHDQKFGESSGKIGFEDSLVSGTKIGIQSHKNINSKKKAINEKRKKIDKIQEKYEHPDNKQEPKRNMRGYSLQEPGRNKNGKLIKGTNVSQKREVQQNVEDGIQASKITAHKRKVFKTKKGSEMLPQERASFKRKKDIEEEMIDEKMNTQTFRFTNQFKSDIDADGEYLLDDEDNQYDEEIAEEIESRSNDSPRNNTKNMKLRKDTGPMEIPSDTNPLHKKKSRQEDSIEGIGTPNSRPPKVPNHKPNTKITLASPAHQIFTTKRQKKELEEQKEKNLEVLEKRYSEPPKPHQNLLASKPPKDEISKDNYLDIGLSNDMVGASSGSLLYPEKRVEMRKLLDKMRSAYTKEALLQTPVGQHNNFN